MDCIFCKIINGSIPSYTIYEDDLIKVLLDVNPDSNGHALIIPKDHYLDLSDIPDDIMIHIVKTARKLKKTLEKKLQIDGLTLIQNNGDVQEIKHFHLHLKPYYNQKQTLKSIEEIYNTLIN